MSFVTESPFSHNLNGNTVKTRYSHLLVIKMLSTSAAESGERLSKSGNCSFRYRRRQRIDQSRFARTQPSRRFLKGLLQSQSFPE
jgi:hypothetical protein